MQLFLHSFGLTATSSAKVCASEIIIITNFIVVPSVVIKRVGYISNSSSDIRCLFKTKIHIQFYLIGLDKGGYPVNIFLISP